MNILVAVRGKEHSPKEREHIDVPPRKDSTEQGPIKLALLRMSADARRGVGSFFSREETSLRRGRSVGKEEKPDQTDRDS